MASLQTIKNELSAIFLHRQNVAKQKAEKNLSIARANPQFNFNYLRLNELNYLIAKKKYGKIDCHFETEEVKKLEKEQKNLLKTLNLSIDCLKPQYTCTKCNDFGFINGKQCTCYKKELTKMMLKNNGITYKNLKKFSEFNPNICSNNEHKKQLETLKKYGLDFINKFNETKIDNIYVCGGTGVGKTFFAECIASELIRHAYYVNVVTAFQMNSTFLSYHGCFDKDKQNILSALLDPDLLVIDDLGTEPILKNVTREYLYLIISERNLHHKKTLITSNLLPSDLIERYGERIFSRLFNKSNSLNISLNGNDLRTKV